MKYNRQKSMKKRCMILILIFVYLACTLISGCNSGKDIIDSGSSALTLPANITDLEQISSSVNIPGKNIVITDGNSIYFSSIDKSFVKTDADGNDITSLVSGEASWPLIADGKIFYAADSGQLSKMEMNGTSHVRIGSQKLSNLIYHENMIYAIEEPDKTLIRVKNDGTGREELVSYPVSCFILRGQSLYIAAKSSQDGLIRFDLRDNNESVLVETAADNLQADGNYLYYSDLQKQYYLYAINLEGFEDYSTDHMASDDQEAIEDKQSSIDIKITQVLDHSLDRQFAVYKSYLYYIDSNSQNQLFKLKLNQNSSIKIDSAELAVDDAVDTFSLLYPFIYYRRADINRLYRTDPTTSRPIRIN